MLRSVQNLGCVVFSSEFEDGRCCFYFLLIAEGIIREQIGHFVRQEKQLYI
jgi:hypothetical protein